MLRLVYLLALVAAARARPEAQPALATTQLHNTLNNEVPQTEAVSTTEAPLNRQYPHAVLFGGTCGGTIIHPNWILTAGHCSLQRSTLFTPGRIVTAGTDNSYNDRGVVRKVKKLHLHPLFAVGPYWANIDEFGINQVHARWDFMLAELESPLPVDGVTIAAVPLDNGEDNQESLSVDYAGFGADHHGGTMRHDMHAMKLRTVSDQRCASLPQYDKLDMLCAEGRTSSRDSACNGDSGSGLVSVKNRRLMGVASWVEDDARVCSPGKLVVFSRVAAARPWIKQVTGLDL